MSRIEVRKCDRCSKFCDDEQHVTITIDAGEGSDGKPMVHAADLCDACERMLTAFLDGAKLARARKVPS